MSIIAEFETASSKLPLSTAMGAAPRMKLEIEREMATIPRQPNLFFWAGGGDFEAFERGLDDDTTVATADRLIEVEGRVLYRVRVSPAATVVTYPEWTRLGADPLSGRYVAGRWFTRMRFPDHEALSEYRTFHEDHEVSFRLHRVYEADHTETIAASVLTDDQRETLRVAAERGFFETPNDTTLADLAAELGTDPETVETRLNRAYMRFVEHLGV